MRVLHIFLFASHVNIGPSHWVIVEEPRLIADPTVRQIKNLLEARKVGFASNSTVGSTNVNNESQVDREQ